MSRDLTPEELRDLSDAMVAEGHMSYEEFCEELYKQFPDAKPYSEE